MHAVERLGSYITRGVYTVSGPFHPFGGAVDIIVVEQPDGSFKSSPWYVRFGKFQGVLKAREKVVTINVNGSEANFHMYLDQRGEAHFEREREEGEGDSDVSFSSDEMDDQSQDSRIITKSFSCNGSNSSSVIQFDGSNGKIVTVTNSQQSRISQFEFGHRSTKDDVYLKDDNNLKVVRMNETAEIAADLVESFMLDERDPGGKLVQISDTLRGTDEFCSKNADGGENPEKQTTSATCSKSRIPDIVESGLEKKADTYQGSHEKDVVLSSVGLAEQGNGLSRVRSSIYCETSRSLIVGSNGIEYQSAEKLYLSNGGSVESHNHVEALHSTVKPLTEDTGNCQAEDFPSNGKDSACFGRFPQETNPSSPSMYGHDRANIDQQVTETSSYTQLVCGDAAIGSSEGKSQGSSSISGSRNSVDQVQDENGDETTGNMLSLHFASVDSVEPSGDCSPTRAPESESSEEDQFFFSDIDDFEPGENQGDSTFPDAVDKDRFVQMNGLHKSESLTENSKVISRPISIRRRQDFPVSEGTQLVGSLPNMWSDFDDLGTQNLHQPLSHSLELRSTSVQLQLNSTNSDTGNGNQSPHANVIEKETLALEGSKDDVDNPAVEISLCKHLLYEGMGTEAASQAFDSEKLDINTLASLGPEVVKNNRLVVRIRGHYYPWDAAAPIVLGIAAFGSENIFEPEGRIPVDQVEQSLVGDPSKAIDSRSGSWRIWPFRRSRSRKTVQSTLTETRSLDSGNTMTSNLDSENDKKDVIDTKKIIKATTPTSDELSSLDLKEGSNAVTFTFSTAMLGRQKVDARIYLWKWNTRIVISDVDGTITKSDVLGQFMPLVGIDWSQTGVVHLFSAIKDNGYEFLYLSARSISQAYITRQFLVNLKQDGKALPDGPVVISPDGLFPSLYREVIRRAPHEFKIACLEDIKALFPPDCSPFYAGFGNRDTDEISYLKVGIPKGKIFIINPKGEVAVNRVVDAKSYTSLHALVHGMFPPATSSEQVQEDYNSWNFWKLPPPHIDDL